MTRLGLLTTLWQRHELSRIVLSHYTDLKIEGVELVPLAVGSEGIESERTAKDCGWHYLEHQNEPLGEKWNFGMQWFWTRRVAGVVVIGSDDLISPQAFAFYRDALKSGHDYVCFGRLYFYEPASGKMAFSGKTPAGTGRMLSAELLNRVRWSPWERRKNRLMDGSMHRVIQHELKSPLMVYEPDEHGVAIVDVKTDVNMWSMDQMTRRCRAEPVDAERTMKILFPNAYLKLKQLGGKDMKEIRRRNKGKYHYVEIDGVPYDESVFTTITEPGTYKVTKKYGALHAERVNERTKRDEPATEPEGIGPSEYK